MHAPRTDQAWYRVIAGSERRERIDDGVVQMVLLSAPRHVRITGPLEAGEVVERVFDGRPVPEGTTVIAPVLGKTWTMTRGGAQ